ncbi:hypothetical protein T310_8847, partial [Rasamsonia emersonii CBS 393.64]
FALPCQGNVYSALLQRGGISCTPYPVSPAISSFPGPCIKDRNRPSKQRLVSLCGRWRSRFDNPAVGIRLSLLVDTGSSIVDDTLPVLGIAQRPVKQDRASCAAVGRQAPPNPLPLCPSCIVCIFCTRRVDQR